MIHRNGKIGVADSRSQPSHLNIRSHAIHTLPSIRVKVNYTHSTYRPHGCDEASRNFNPALNHMLKVARVKGLTA